MSLSTTASTWRTNLQSQPAGQICCSKWLWSTASPQAQAPEEGEPPKRKKRRRKDKINDEDAPGVTPKAAAAPKEVSEPRGKSLHVDGNPNQGLPFSRRVLRPCQPNMVDGPLHLAIQTCHVEALQLLLDAFADAEARDPNGQTPLHCAAWNGDFASMQLLLQAGADKDAKDHENATPLFLAACRGHAGCVCCLLRARADADFADIWRFSEIGTTALTAAAANDHVYVVQVLLEAGVDKNQTTRRGETALLCAALNLSAGGSAETVRFLLKARADGNVASPEEGHTPLFVAAIRNHRRIAGLLIEAGVDPDKADRQDRRPMDVATFKRNFEVAQLLAKAGGLNQRIEQRLD
eukprot:s2138_g2.t1